MAENGLYCIKMRASRGGAHVSGAERITPASAAPKTAALLAARALAHPKGTPDFVNIKLESCGGILRLEALPVTTADVRTPAEGRRVMAETLARAGVTRIDEIMSLFRLTYGMRGAMLLDADTLERLEPDRSRGVRATYMDDARSLERGVSAAKDHYAEAVVLATKVANAPGMIGEICVSDDPDYTTGYVATRESGYVRLPCVKEPGDPNGGRIFLYRGPRDGVAETIEFLERRCVLVYGAEPLAARTLQTARPASRFASLEEDLRRIDAEGLNRSVPGPAAPGALVMSSNDYLGLADGAGSTGSRLTTGTHREHLDLERHIAAFKGTEAALLYSTGYMANVGVISAIAGRGDAIFSDRLNHASIIDGCRLSGADVFIYDHLDMDDLERKIAAAGRRRRMLAVSDAVFSMDGDMLDLPRFLEVCARRDVFSMIDEAHATGVIGRTGRGLVEHFGCAHPDIAVGTLSKAIGAEGGFVCANSLVVRYLVNRSRPFIFSTAMSPRQAAAADAALSRLEAEPQLVERLRENVRLFLAELEKHGISVRTDSAIVPVPVGDERRAVEAAARLAKVGITVHAIRYPTVERGRARLRVAVSAAHTARQLERAARCIAEAVRA